MKRFWKQGVADIQGRRALRAVRSQRGVQLLVEGVEQRVLRSMAHDALLLLPQTADVREAPRAASSVSLVPIVVVVARPDANGPIGPTLPHSQGGDTPSGRQSGPGDAPGKASDAPGADGHRSHQDRKDPDTGDPDTGGYLPEYCDPAGCPFSPPADPHSPIGGGGGGGPDPDPADGGGIGGGGGYGGDGGGYNGGTGACFIAGTPVMMADGTLKPIEQVQVEDLVLSRDERTGQTAPQRVLRKWDHKDRPTLLLILANGERIETTREHPFHIAGEAFVAAGHLKPGACLSTRTRHEAEVAALEPQADRVVVYNLTVENFHTYFVGDSGLWVHNEKMLDKPTEGDDDD
jgi:hypothetical protein